MKKLSVVTVSLNAERFIERAVLSVRSQTYPHIEHVVIDGGSTDGTLGVIEKYRDGLAYFVSEPDGGLYDAMNKGVRASTGDVVFFLNADDYFSDGRVCADAMAVFNRDPAVEVVFGDQVFDLGSGKTAVKDQSAPQTRERLARTTIQHQTLFASRRLFDQVGLFTVGYRVVSDYEWILKVFVGRGCRHRHIARPITVMATGGLSWKHDFEGERTEVMRKFYSRGEILRHRVLPMKLHRLRLFGDALKEKLGMAWSGR
jgi:hypothetical protein